MTNNESIKFTPQEHAILKFKLENDFLFFCQFFHKETTGDKFIANSHHIKIAKLMSDIAAYKVGNAVINIPPRYGKTQMGVVYWIAWCLAKNPKARFIHLSYSVDLALENSSKIKELVEDDLFQMFWQFGLKQDSKSKKKWYTEHGGGVYAGGSGGTIRGFGAGDITDEENKPFGGAIVIDDPMKGDKNKRPSLTEIETINGRLNSPIMSRRNSRLTPIIIIMQRLHTMDMTAYVLGGATGEPFHHLNLSAIQVVDGVETALWAQKHTLEELKNMHKTDPFVFAGEYLQEPVPAGGAMFKLPWLKYYDPAIQQKHWVKFNPYILVDAANSKKRTADYTAMMVVLTGSDRNYYVGDIIRDRLNPTERINKLIELHQKWLSLTGKPPKVGYEKYGMMSDTFYLAEAMKQNSYNMNVIELGGRLAKEERVARLVPLFQESRIYIPKYLWYVDANNERRDMIREFIDTEYSFFPVSSHDDMLDALARITDSEFPMMFPKMDVNTHKYDSTKYKQDKDIKSTHFLNM